MPQVEGAAEEKVFAAEQGIAGIRVLVIVLNSLTYLFLLDKEGTVPWLAHLIIVGALVYSLAVYLLEPYRRFPVMMSSYFTSALDAVFITLWIYATGGVQSPFHLLWVLSVVAVAFRYDFRESLFAAFLYSASYLSLLAVLGEIRGHEGELVIRVGYVFLAAAIGGLSARETMQQTREKVQLRELAEALRESEEQFRRLSDAAFEGIAIHEEGRILESNRAFARMFGYAPEEVVRLYAFDLIDPAYHGVIRENLRFKTDLPYEAVARRKDGSPLDVEIVGRDFPLGGRTVRVVAVRDVTERKRAQREARQRELLQAEHDRLKAIDAMKGQFINNAAHELGTPLTPIKVQAHLLRTGTLGPLNERQQRAVDVLERNVQHLGVMVRDLLDASRLQSGSMRLDRRAADVSTLLRHALESYEEAAGEAGVRLSCECEKDLVAEVDAPRVNQVLLNLLGNALKFTPRGGSVTLRARRDGDALRVEVDDTGGGIPPEDQARLFQPFSQVHDKMQRTRSGAGLGLFISRGIVEAHGGRIWCESEGAGRGSRFAFTLPARASGGAAVEVPAHDVQ